MCLLLSLTAYVLRSFGLIARPDENFAREIMQLFSIGIHHLNMDGTKKLSSSTGLPIPTYRNTDIQTFARAWTGFKRQPARGNIEIHDWGSNRIDPMALDPRWRDVFPKMDLNGGYIGDLYPLCSDIPQRAFLNIGAKYILLGSSAVPEYQSGDELMNEIWVVTLSLNRTSSELFNILCNAGPDSQCRFRPVVILNRTLNCQGNECLIDEPRTIRLSDNPPIFYEYIRPACVELTFFPNNGRIVRKNAWPSNLHICANPLVDKAYEACCPKGETHYRNFCLFTGERVLYNTAEARCSTNSRFNDGVMCDYTWNYAWDSNPGCDVGAPEDWHWTNLNCTVQVKGENQTY